VPCHLSFPSNQLNFLALTLLHSCLSFISSVQGDMDFSNSPLLGQHGYCTQELMNLLTMGRAISNAFDHEYVLDEKRLKGISSQADIGLLSLFEHYNSCSVRKLLISVSFGFYLFPFPSNYV